MIPWCSRWTFVSRAEELGRASAALAASTLGFPGHIASKPARKLSLRSGCVFSMNCRNLCLLSLLCTGSTCAGSQQFCAASSELPAGTQVPAQPSSTLVWSSAQPSPAQPSSAAPSVHTCQRSSVREMAGESFLLVVTRLQSP